MAWRIRSTVAGADTPVVHFSPSSTFASACFTSWTGVDPYVLTDSGYVQHFAAVAQGDHNGNSFTATYANEVIYVFGNVYTSGGIPAASGYTQIFRDSGSGAGSSYILNVSSGTTHGVVNQPQAGATQVDLNAITLVPNLTSPTTISALAWTIGPTTVTAQWTTANPGTTQLACGTVMGGPYTLAGLEDNTTAIATSHHDIVVGLTVGTAYYCVATSATGGGSVSSAEQAATTPAAFGSVTLTGATAVSTVSASAFGTRYNDLYNASPNTFCEQGDSYFNTVSNAGTTFQTLNDTWWFITNACSGSVTGTGSALAINTLTGSTPTAIRGTTLNHMSSFGNAQTAWKAFSLNGLSDFYNNDSLFLFTSYQTGFSTYGDHEGSNLSISTDQGVTWSLWSAPLSFSANGSAPASQSSNFFGATNNPIAGANSTSPFGVVTAVNYMPGNTDTLLNDQQNAYVYYVACGVNTAVNDSAYSNGDKAFLIRVPRWQIWALNTATQVINSTAWQMYSGGGADGTLDSSWTTTNWPSAGTPFFSSAGKVGWCGMQWIPRNNRYLLTTTVYNSGTTNTQVIFYDMAHPWSTPAQIYSFNTSSLGLFQAVPLQASMTNFLSSGNQLTIIGTGDYATGGAGNNYSTTKYGPYYATYSLQPIVPAGSAALMLSQ